MKIVVDTNVVISGIFFGGNPRKIVEAVAAGSIDAYATTEIIDEYTGMPILECPNIFCKVLAFIETRQNESISVKTLVIWLQYHHQYIYFYLQFPLGRMIHHNLSRHIPLFHLPASSARTDTLLLRAY